ncbi:MAG: hypothetical protein IKF72_05950 [Kiritimatiellae bacterium]|nr:hypothetical protein [Kiritimatiellia bacterium]
MSGLNSLSGLNNVSVDFRPVIGPDVKNTGNTNQPPLEVDAVPENAPPEKAEAKSVVRELDVLLLNAAGKSVSADVTKNVTATGKALVDIGLLSQKDVSKLESLADNATAKLKALDKFSGRELAKALMQDKSGEIVWGKSFWGMNSVAKAVKDAIESQQALSEAIEKFGQRIAKSDKVSAELQNAFTEVQFQCDRRVSEIDSIVFKMYALVQQDVVDKVDADPQITALLNATFKELMPREVILSHGTAESLELVNKTFGEKMRPLAEKLDDFAADGSKVLGNEEILALQRDMEEMKSALENVRRNGINETVMTSHEGMELLDDNGVAIKKMTEVDSSLLDEMEKLLADVSNQIADARNVSVKRSRQMFLEEVKAMLSPENALGGDKAMSSGPATGNGILYDFKLVRKEFVELIRDFALGKLPMEEFDGTFNACIAKFREVSANLETALVSVGIDETTSKSVAKAVKGIHLVKAQFRALMESSERLKNGGEDPGLATIDVRRIMLGEVGISNVIEAKVRGFKPGDVDPATEESNIASSKTLGSGMAGKTYLLTTKSGEELVFKSEFDSRIGMSSMLLGANGAYRDAQKTVNLNLATQDTAKAFGCEDLVVKYSVGSHAGQFGFFMEKAKGYSGGDFSRKRKIDGGNGIAPASMHKTVPPGQEQVNIQGAIAQKLNRLMWLDLITGQGDRHWDNYFVDVEKNEEKKDDYGNAEYDVTVKAIDNDASFAAWKIGLQKYVIDRNTVARFGRNLKKVCENVLGKEWENEFNVRVSKDPGIVKNAKDGSLTIDFAKVKSPEVKMAIIRTLGMQSVALPEEIDEDFYNKLMEMDRDPAKKQAYLGSLASRISPKALKATENRLNEAIEHAKKLKQDGKVYNAEQWKINKNLRWMSPIEPELTIKKSDKTVVTVNRSIDCVNDFLVQDCPSYFKRDYMHLMFNKPKSAV